MAKNSRPTPDIQRAATRPGATPYQAVSIGVSAGGVKALHLLLSNLPANFPLPILIVQHIGPETGDGLARLLDEYASLRVKEADEQERILPGTVYLAPPNYHLLVERGGYLSLSADPPVCYARPSVDVLFESAALAFGAQLIGIVLTGANFDGSSGLAAIKKRGGLTIVQDPETAEAPQMPRAALAATQVDYVVSLDALAGLLQELAPGTKAVRARTQKK